MTLVSSGTISISDINSEFSRGNNLGGYRGTTWYKDDSSTGTFSTPTLAESEFYAKRLTNPVTGGSQTFTTSSGTFTIPNYNNLSIVVKSAKGADVGGYTGGQGGYTNVSYVVATGPAVGSTISYSCHTFVPGFSYDAMTAVINGKSLTLRTGVGGDSVGDSSSGGGGGSGGGGPVFYPGSNGIAGAWSNGVSSGSGGNTDAFSTIVITWS